MSYKISQEGIDYEMGASINDVGRGDAVKVGPGKIEVIAKIESSGRWDKRITTESGRVLSMLDVLAYGKKQE